MRDFFQQDFRYALRQLKGSPVFTIVAMLSLALGIGANAAIFQLVDSIILKTLPVRSPEQLVTVDLVKGSNRSGWFSTRSARLTYALWEEIGKRQESFSDVMAWSATRFDLTRGGEKKYAEGLYVTGGYFRLLGAEPLLGRALGPQDDTAACANPGAVLSHSFWQRELGGDPRIEQRPVTLNGRVFPVIGVMRAEFYGTEVGRRFDVAVPLCVDKLLAEDHQGRAPVKHAWWLSMMGRLKPGWTLSRADSHLKAISPAVMGATVPGNYHADGIAKYKANKLEAQDAGSGVSYLRRQYSQALWMLGGTTALLLLIACANLANLLLARASVRQREIAVRMAIGSSRWRVIRQLMVESLLLVTGGSVLALALARALSGALLGFLDSAQNPLYVNLAPDWRLMLFLAGVALLTCVLFGLAPALRATSVAPVTALRGSGRGMVAGREGFSLRRTLMATQVALSLVLIVGAMLFAGSLRRILTTDAGFQAEGILTVQVDAERAQIPKPRRLAAQRELGERLAAVPGVVSSAQTQFTPMSYSGWNNEIGPDNARAEASGKIANFNRVSPGYFRTMGTPLLAGRDISDQDQPASPEVAVVNEAFAKKFFNGDNPVGRTFHRSADPGKPEPVVQIVGMAKSSKYYDMTEDYLPMVYLPAAQENDPDAGGQWVVRVNGSPSAVIAAMKAAVAQVSPVYGVEFHSFSRQLDESLQRERMMAALSTAFAVLAGVLAALGLYGVISYMVARRRSEIGLRMALGAGRGGVIGLVLREALLLLGAGVVVGLLLAYWGARTAESLLYQLKAHDPVSLGGAVALLSLIGLAAAWLPARRAASLDPMTALRDE